MVIVLLANMKYGEIGILNDYTIKKDNNTNNILKQNCTHSIFFEMVCLYILYFTY